MVRRTAYILGGTPPGSSAYSITPPPPGTLACVVPYEHHNTNTRTQALFNAVDDMPYAEAGIAVLHAFTSTAGVPSRHETQYAVRWLIWSIVADLHLDMRNGFVLHTMECVVSEHSREKGIHSSLLSQS